MTEPATPAAAPAAPAAPAPVVDPAVPAAPAAPAAVAPPAAPAAAAPTVTSILDGAPAAPAAPVVAEPEWFLAPGVKGEGKAPEWFKGGKYKTVDEQAKAYTEAEKLLGGFTGAPKDGYKFNLPEGVELVEGYDLGTDPLFKDFADWAKETNMSQDKFDKCVAIYAKHTAAGNAAPDLGEIKKELGDKADERIGAVASWAKANFDEATFQQLRTATSGANAAAVFAVVEAAILKTRQPALPAPGADVPGSQATGEEAINIEFRKLGADGKPLYFSDPQHRAKVEKARVDLYNARAGKAA